MCKRSSFLHPSGFVNSHFCRLSWCGFIVSRLYQAWTPQTTSGCYLIDWLYFQYMWFHYAKIWKLVSQAKCFRNSSLSRPAFKITEVLRHGDRAAVYIYHTSCVNTPSRCIYNDGDAYLSSVTVVPVVHLPFERLSLSCTCGRCE